MSLILTKIVSTKIIPGILKLTQTQTLIDLISPNESGYANINISRSNTSFRRTLFNFFTLTIFANLMDSNLNN